MAHRRQRQSKPVGRPTRYQPAFAEQVHRLALLGCTEEEMARIFGVGLTTWRHWKAKHPEFNAGLREGKDFADARVARSLLDRALGFERDAVKIYGNADTGASLAVPYKEYYPPDVNAAKFWLANRQPERWRHNPEGASALALAGAAASANTVTGVSEDVMEAIRAKLKAES